VPFDGARLLVPSHLPSTFVGATEWGGDEPQSSPQTPVGSSGSSSPATQVATTSRWSFLYADTGQNSSADRCLPGRGDFSISQAPRDAADLADGVDLGVRRVGAVTARLQRKGGSDVTATAWTLTWLAAGGTVQLASQQRCEGDHILSPGELLQAAQALKPR
jgi:hypothetical protein